MRPIVLPLAFAAVLAACGGSTAEQAAVSDSLAAPAAAAAGDTLVVDTVSSTLGWTGYKVTGKHDGDFKAFRGFMIADTNAVQAVSFTIDTRTITADNERLTEHLKSEDFFAVEQYPVAEFVSTSIVPVADSLTQATGQQTQFTVTGNLTMRGVTKAVTFPASIRRSPGSAAARAEFSINRKDWGIVYTGKPDDLIRDAVDIHFNVVARKRGVAAPGGAIRAANAYQDSVRAAEAADGSQATTPADTATWGPAPQR